jgi:predicted YcjX-like family ATPase
MLPDTATATPLLSAAIFPSEDAWKPDDYRSYSFQPIKFPSKEGTPVPHINLDQLLGHILQDYL